MQPTSQPISPSVTSAVLQPAHRVAEARQIETARQISSLAQNDDSAAGQTNLRSAFNSFVGQTLFSQTLSAMRKTVGQPAYFHGGRAEEVFQSQLDQQFADKLTEASSERLTGPMFDLFMMNRQP